VLLTLFLKSHEIIRIFLEAVGETQPRPPTAFMTHYAAAWGRICTLRALPALGIVSFRMPSFSIAVTLSVSTSVGSSTMRNTSLEQASE
jgi:hypothetical protein